MDRLANIEIFVRVAQTQSFAEAARQLRVSKSVVTTRVRQLEDYLGAPLFHRSTHFVRVSDFGQEFLEDCADLVGRANDVVDQMRERHGRLEGTLKLHVLTGLTMGNFAALLQRFQEVYPDIQFDLTVSDAIVDPIKLNVDCTLQIFPAGSAELISRQLFPMRRVFCATPRYLQEHGTPETPVDLHAHKLGLYSGYPTRDRWEFHRDSKVTTLHLNAAILTNSVYILREYALGHAGIACLPTVVASDALLDGRLKLVLPDFLMPTFWLSAVYPSTSRHAYKLKLFITHLITEFTRTPPWDAALLERDLLLDQLIDA
jgi:DNA-binding transcriptional LysR family regulator